MQFGHVRVEHHLVAGRLDREHAEDVRGRGTAQRRDNNSNNSNRRRQRGARKGPTVLHRMRRVRRVI